MTAKGVRQVAWSTDEKRDLSEWHRLGRTPEWMAAQLPHRTVRAVEQMLHQMGLHRIKRKYHAKGEGIGDALPEDKKDGRLRISATAANAFAAGVARHLRHKQAERQRAQFNLVDGGEAAE